MTRAASRFRWTEADSRTFDACGDAVVPSRAEQLETLCALIPAGPDETFTAVELGAGNGTLARAVLDRFPHCRYLALDGSPYMRARLRRALAAFGPRARVAPFRLEERGWRTVLPHPLRCVLASLVVHHLSAGRKRRLFADVAAHLEPGGALLVADLVEPAAPRVKALFASQWDRAARRQSRLLPAGARLAGGDWNYYRLEQSDPVDQPSRLFDQLRWLRSAGFPAADCFWMRAGHAIFGGYRAALPRAVSPTRRVTKALRAVTRRARRPLRRARGAAARRAAGTGRTSRRSRRTRSRTPRPTPAG